MKELNTNKHPIPSSGTVTQMQGPTPAHSEKSVYQQRKDLLLTLTVPKLMAMLE